MKVILLLGMFGFNVMAFGASADGKEAESRPRRFSDNSAIIAFDPDEGFKMRDTALQTLGIRFQKLDGKAPWGVTKQALVHIKHTTGVYRRFEGWISFVLVKVKAHKDETVTIESEDLQTGDEVATEGAPFLRMTEADLNSDTVDNCAH